MAENSGLNIVMFPWLAFGHLIPFLELSKCLVQRGHRVSFVSTPRNIERLPKIPPNLSPLLNLVKLPLPHVDNLPDNAEATIDVPYDKIQYLKKAYDGLEPPLVRFLESSAPDWIIYDFAPHWLPPVATKLGLPSAYFNIFNAATMAFFGPPSMLMSGEDSRTEPEHFTVPPNWITFPSNLAFRLHEILKIFDSIEGNITGVSDAYRFGATLQGCDVVVVRSCIEFEGEFLRLSEEEICRKPVLSVGLLPPTVEENEDENWNPINEWLDKQEARSVVYVALGSEVTLSEEEVTELALGLELAELPFFWVLRRPPGSVKDESALLPGGFEERTKGRGFVCTGWAPQLRILAHPSVGGFLTHCGWSSIIEALGFGISLLMLPLLSTQGLNARVLEWKKIGLEIARNERDGFFTRDSVAESLKVIMVSEEGEMYRTNAKEMRDVFGDKDRHNRYVDDFDQYLKEHRRLR